MTEKGGMLMDQSEIHARATIAAALVVSRAVEVPTIRSGGDWSADPVALRLRELTDYVYRIISAPDNVEPPERPVNHDRRR